MSDYMPPQPPIQRHRRSERAQQVQQAMQEKQTQTTRRRSGSAERPQASADSIRSVSQAKRESQSRQVSGATAARAPRQAQPKLEKPVQPTKQKKPEKPVKQERSAKQVKPAKQDRQAKQITQAKPASSREAWTADEWQQDVHPGRQGYKPVQPQRMTTPRYAPQNVQQPAPVPGQPVGNALQTAYGPQGGYQEQPWQMPVQQPDYRQQPYGYQQPYGGYGAGQNQQPVWNTQSGMQPVDPYGGPMNQGGGQKPRKQRTLLRNVLLILLCAGMLAGAGTILKQVKAQQALVAYVASYDEVFCEGVYVDGIHLGGMTAEQGLYAVQTQAQQRNDAWSVRLTYQGQLVQKITASDLNMTTDVTSVLNEAWKQGHIGDTETRKAAMDALLADPYEGYTAMPSSDTSVIDTILENIRNQVYRAPQDAQILTFDPEKTNPFTFQEEVAGRYLDTEPVKEQLYQMVSSMESGSIELTPESIQPVVTVADLEKTVALRASAYTKISTTSTENRNKNIIRSCQQISGTIIQPGEQFSFNGVVGERTEANGFYSAIEYANGEHVEGIGGGVCQASTTVYLAAVYAGMQIDKREPHSDAVGYTDYGKDATVYWQYGRKIDFKFTNNTDSAIYMVARVQSDPDNKKRLICKVEIYGLDMEGVTYDLVTETVEVLTPGDDIIVKDKQATYVTYTDEQYVQRKASDGYVVDSYRVKYVDGTEVERTKLYTDTYAAKAQRIYVGVTTRPTE